MTPDDVPARLARELKATQVPYDAARVDEMIRSVTDAGLLGRPGWAAPLAAAAAVVAVGGGVTLATTGGHAQRGTPAGGGGLPACPSIGAIPTASATPPASASDLPLSDTVAPRDVTVTLRVPQRLANSAASAASAAASAASSAAAAIAGSSVPLPVGSGYYTQVAEATGTATPGAAPETSAGRSCVATATAVPASPLPSRLPTASPTAAPSGPAGSPTYCADGAVCAEPVAVTVETHVRAGQRGGSADEPKIPEGYQLAVTSLVLRNPAADHGTISVSVGSNIVLRENLASFRHLDYHFVDEPVIFTRQAPVVIGVNCADTGRNCTPSVLVSGQLERVR